MKKIVVLLLTFFCFGVVLAGCASTANHTETVNVSPEASVKASDMISEEVMPELVIDDETKKKIEQTEVKDASVYFDWTITEWEAADDAERETCVLTYIAMKNETATNAEQQTQNISDMKNELETLLKENPGKSVKELVESE